ncbi:MAG: hypothetical protein IPL27_11695 [Lewinellaceae bacterium]|nr:hypothetical protein [Lewinellaceae bacterium]
MKTTKWMLLPLLAAALTTASWYFFYTPSLTISASNVPNTNFKVSGLDPHTQGDRDARYSILLNPGDGRYVIVETQNPIS